MLLELEQLEESASEDRAALDLYLPARHAGKRSAPSRTARCWRLAQMFGKDKEMFAYEPLHGYSDDGDAVELPWQRWERDAHARGLGLAELFAEAPPAHRSDPLRRVR